MDTLNDEGCVPCRPLCVRREKNATFLNFVVNHPEVKRWVAPAYDGYLDMSSVIQNPENVMLSGDGGGIVFLKLAPGVYEAHTQFLPEFRGKNAIRVCRDALQWMFTRTDANILYTKVPEGNSAAEHFTRTIGGRFLFNVSNCWRTESSTVGANHYALTLDEWITGKTTIAQVGHWFHKNLEAAKTATGSTLVVHDDDDCHDRYVGAAVEMIAAGNIKKGIETYNLWARLAGYAAIRIVSDAPPVIDIQDALIAVRNNSMEVILCR